MASTWDKHPRDAADPKACALGRRDAPATVAAEQVARALAANCAKLQTSIAQLEKEPCSGLVCHVRVTSPSGVVENPSGVQPEEEQPRVQDEKACFEQYAAQY